MKDGNGSYYYPNPADTRARVYVRQGQDEIEFRLWHSDFPEAWERHGWIGYAAIQEMAGAYSVLGHGSDPLILYDIKVALGLLKDEERGAERSLQG